MAITPLGDPNDPFRPPKRPGYPGTPIPGAPFGSPGVKPLGSGQDYSNMPTYSPDVYAPQGGVGAGGPSMVGPRTPVPSQPIPAGPRTPVPSQPIPAGPRTPIPRQPIPAGPQFAPAPMNYSKVQAPGSAIDMGSQTYAPPGGVGAGGPSRVPGDPAAAPPAPATHDPSGAWRGGGDMSPSEAGAAGLGWVPKDHPLYGTPGYVGSTPAAAGGGGAAPGAAPDSYYGPPGGGAPPGSPGTTPGDPNAAQGERSKEFSPTPQADPEGQTTNQGSQDVFLNELIERMIQSRTPDQNDPVIRQQADVFSAAQERARRQAQASAAERASVTGADAGLANETRAMNERAAQTSAGFEADLVGREVQNRRDEIRMALGMFGNTLSEDQRRALQREEMSLNAQLERERLAQAGRLGEGDLSLRRDLGYGGLNLDAARLAQQGKQWSDRFGFDIADREAYYNARAMENLLGG